MKKITLTYLAGYLLIGGLGLAFAPEFTLKLFFSTGEYGTIMPRVVGMFMLALGSLIASFVYFRDYRYYNYSVYARTFIVLFLYWLYTQTADPLFILLIGVVLIGLLPSMFEMIRSRNRAGILHSGGKMMKSLEEDKKMEREL